MTDSKRSSPRRTSAPIRPRPAAHAGSAYPRQPRELRATLAQYFAAVPSNASAADCKRGRRALLRGLLSPHIDPTRGARGYVRAYGRLAEDCRATTFVIFGTAHDYMQKWFCATDRDFATPLGVVRTDRRYLAKLTAHLSSSLVGRHMDLFAEAPAHRGEHSIEFQVLFLRYVLGARRPLRIVPILVSSFVELIERGLQPDDCPEIQCFLAALRAAEAAHSRPVCYVSGADLAHLGRRFGDRGLLGARHLAALETDDRKLLAQVCHGSADGWFRHVARCGDRNRICGLAPTYMLLKAVGLAKGELLHYGQAVAAGGTACVSFASVALYGQES